MSESTQKLSDAGVSIWLDDLSRERLTSGNLAELIKTHNVVGVTTNPTIFAGALCGLFMGGNEIFIYYPDLEPVKAIIYVASSVISGAVIAGFLAWILVKNLAKTGVLSSLASGNTRR